MYKPQKARPSDDFDSEIAKSHLGKHLLFGISYVDSEGKLLNQRQNHGIIVEITAQYIAVQLYGSEEIFTLPPFVNELETATSGEYKLRSTGEVVINLELIGRFKCISSKKQDG